MKKCAKNIIAGEDVRAAIDPISKNVLDNSQAFISIDPVQPGTVLYFETEENLKKYFNN